jgi:hypothetical protein
MSAKVRELAMMGVPKTRRSTWHCEVADPVGDHPMLKMR